MHSVHYDLFIYRSDLSNEEFPAAYQGILTVQINLMEAFYNDYCIEESKSRENYA